MDERTHLRASLVRFQTWPIRVSLTSPPGSPRRLFEARTDKENHLWVLIRVGREERSSGVNFMAKGWCVWGQSRRRALRPLACADRPPVCGLGGAAHCACAHGDEEYPFSVSINSHLASVLQSNPISTSVPKRLHLHQRREQVTFPFLFPHDARTLHRGPGLQRERMPFTHRSCLYIHRWFMPLQLMQLF